jgi:ketosteroid isomerase-like protein
MTKDERAIRELMHSWFVSGRRGDLAILLELIDDDTIFRLASKPPFDKAAFADV